MPNKEFLERYPLYKKFKMKDIPERMDTLPDVRVNMACPNCQSDQTFLMTNKYYENLEFANYPAKGIIFRMVYLCIHCQKFHRQFFIKIDEKKQWIMKVGQYPAWEIRGEPNIEKLLGIHADYYKKGLVCESQGYGIGAFGYYRRIVEETIDGLLNEISDLLIGEELENYKKALEKVKATTVTQDKIELVKGMLPAILRPDGMNPLSVLHSILSEGLHAESDEACLDYAESCREILIFLVNQVAASKATSHNFTESMRKLLDKKGPKK